jgi:hypothetical protein
VRTFEVTPMVYVVQLTRLDDRLKRASDVQRRGPTRTGDKRPPASQEPHAAN